ncbi:MAG: hypothetical protein NTU95_05905 [Methanothrix sp.]|nr:hypothetical protein [Methanothrix sp.]
MNDLFKYIWKKELQGELYTWKSMTWLVIASLLFSFTSYLLLTDRELSLLDQTELMLLFGQIIIGVALLIITIDASSIVTAEFENETAESLFLTPLSLKDFLLGKFLASLTLWVFLFVVSLPYIFVTSSGSHLTLEFIGYTALWSEPLRVDNELSNVNSWREVHEKDEAALRPSIQDISSS